jgi:hypothetical protein
MQMKELTIEKAKWRWALLPLSPIAIAVGLIVGAVMGLKRPIPPLLSIDCKKQNRGEITKIKKGKVRC